MERGEVRWYTFNPPDKRRPVLILTRSTAVAYLNTVTVAAISTTIRDVPSEVYLSTNEGMSQECSVNLYNLHTVDQNRIGPLITILSPAKIQAVDQALRFALGIDAF